MSYRDKNVKSPIDTFRVGDHRFTHDIFIADDDRVECRNMTTNELVMTYDSSCNVLKGDAKEHIGKVHMVDDMLWEYRSDDEATVMKFGRDVLVGEIEISKHYIKLWDTVPV